LKQRCGFARIHCGKSEVEFGQKISSAKKAA